MYLFNDTAPTEIYTLSLHDALPILDGVNRIAARRQLRLGVVNGEDQLARQVRRLGNAEAGDVIHSVGAAFTDRKSTRLNSSHPSISYAVFCLKKKKTTKKTILTTH